MSNARAYRTNERPNPLHDLVVGYFKDHPDASMTVEGLRVALGEGSTTGIRSHLEALRKTKRLVRELAPNPDRTKGPFRAFAYRLRGSVAPLPAARVPPPAPASRQAPTAPAKVTRVRALAAVPAVPAAAAVAAPSLELRILELEVGILETKLTSLRGEVSRLRDQLSIVPGSAPSL